MTLTQRDRFLNPWRPASGGAGERGRAAPWPSWGWTCWQIRDDKGTWEQLEVYIAGHSEAEFTHGLCSDCLRNLYPEQVENLKKKGLLRFVKPEAE